MKNTWLSLLVFITCSSLSTAVAQGQSLNGVFAGTAGTPITFTLESDCIINDPEDTAYWDFGSESGATPSTAITDGIYDGVISEKIVQSVTYSTAGEKKFTLTIVNPKGSSGTNTFALHVYDCSTPSIPHDAIVISSDTTVALYLLKSSKTYWVNPGAVLNFTGGSSIEGVITIFAEPGSTITGAGNCRLYMKHGSVFTSSVAYNSVIYGGGATINPHSLDFTLDCPALDFDYSNAPPNAAHPLSVKNVLDAGSITLSPNPTRGSVSIKGLSLNIQNICVINILGETVMEQKDVHSPDFTLDLSKLIPGTYYIRFSSANSVVTKKIVKE